MGAFEHLPTGRIFVLNERCLIGRASTCHWVDDDLKVSGEHSVVSYKAGHWTFRDLSSTNGSWTSGQRVDGILLLEVGVTVSLGHPGNTYRFVEDSAPAALVHPPSDSDTPLRVDGCSVLLPNDANPEASILRSASGWIVEIDGTARPAVDGELLKLSSGNYRIELPCGESGRMEATVPVQNASSPYSARFVVSPNEEHVSLELCYGGERSCFEHRSYSYLLLTLARQRILDQASAFASGDEDGWCETRELAKSLQVTPEHLNLWVWRARRHVESLHPELNALLVERRPSLGLLRLGTGELSVGIS